MVDVELAMPARQPILIVEDDVDTREALKFLLETYGYAVVVAGDGADGLAKLHAGLRPSLILLDLLMPKKNGFQFRVEQAMDAELSEIPVAVYSGNPDACRAEALAGAVAHLHKPIEVEKLLEVVRAYCVSG